MKPILTLMAVIIFTCCKGQETKENINNVEQKMKNSKIKKYEYRHNKKIFYGIGISAFASVEVYINDILIAKKETAGNISLGVELNEWLLENGLHTYKVRYLPQKGKSMVFPYLLEETDITIDHWEYVENSVEKPLSKKENYTEERMRIPVPPTEVPVWEVTGKFEVIDLPYKLQGWKNSLDLSKIDRDELEKEVVDYYKYLRNLLNNGEVEEYLSQSLQKDQEIATSMYDENLDWYTGKERKNELIDDCKGKMLEIENYKMEIFGKGKLVKLVRVDEILRNKSCLQSESETAYTSYGVILHKPKGLDSFKIIRK